jgi:hypothetical protein
VSTASRPSPYIYPATTVDPQWKAITGKFAYGFNLDGRGAGARNGFEDPETHEKGVNNELYRALGCYISMRGSLSGRPTYWAWAWGQLKDSQPAWLITIEGADLSKDGDVTVTFDRALEHLKSNVDGSPRADATYRIDSDFRSHNAFKGQLRNGVVTISDHGDFRMLQNPLVAPEFKLSKTHLRMRLKQDGSLDAFIGGYQPWSDLYFSFASGGIGIEQCVTGDIPGLYWLMRKHADADPDPKTGQNTTISATYYIEGVPAFAAAPVPNTQKVAGSAARDEQIEVIGNAFFVLSSVGVPHRRCADRARRRRWIDGLQRRAFETGVGRQAGGVHESSPPRPVYAPDGHAPAVGRAVPERHSATSSARPSNWAAGSSPICGSAACSPSARATVSITAAGMEQYDSMARRIAGQVVDEKRRDTDAALQAGQSATGADDACAGQVMARVGRILYRRPLTQTELAAYVTVANVGAVKTKNFYSGLSLSLAAMLSSPKFLFRRKWPRPIPITPAAIASTPIPRPRSSVSSCGIPAPTCNCCSTPREKGNSTPAKGIAEQVERMMTASPRLEEGVRAFFVDNFGFDEFETLTKDTTLFPKFSAASPRRRPGANPAHDRRPVDQESNGDYRDIFTTKKTFLTQELGAIYRMPVVDDCPNGAPDTWQPNTEFAASPTRAAASSPR